MAGVAGCLGIGSSDTDDAETPAVALQAAVRDGITEAHPARLQITFTNRSDRSVVVLHHYQGQRWPFNTVWGTDREGTARVGVFRVGGDAVLCAGTPARSPVPDALESGCWQARCTDLERQGVHGHFALEPGESIADDYLLLDGGNDACLPAGEYSFDHQGTASARVAYGKIDDGSEIRTATAWMMLERSLTVTIAADQSVTAGAAARVGASLTEEQAADGTPQSTPQEHTRTRTD